MILWIVPAGIIVLAASSISCHLYSEFNPLIEKKREITENDNPLQMMGARVKCLKADHTGESIAKHASCEPSNKSSLIAESSTKSNSPEGSLFSLERAAKNIYKKFGYESACGIEKNKSPFVIVLEWLIVTCLIAQMHVIHQSWVNPFKYKLVSERMFYLSDWALNSPPVLGVLANLYAFAQLLASGVTSLNGTFLRYFGEAVSTTIIGGGAYIIILLSRVFVKGKPGED